MHILILNWRDIKNPLAGGAEVLTHEMGKRWVLLGHEVTQISQRFEGCLTEEIVDGVKVIRKGKWWSVHIFACVEYVLKLSHKIDIVIDEIHWFPYFSIFYIHKKIVLIVCEVANPLFFKLLPYPIALLVRIAEKLTLYCYRHVPMIAISQSTKQDLIHEGIRPDNIYVIPLGLNKPDMLIKRKKENIPTIIYLGRIHRLKGIEDAIEVFRFIHMKHENWNFWIIGKGDPSYVDAMKHRVYKYHMDKVTKFYGYISEKDKYESLCRAHILVVPSYYEGWGLNVSEAALMGTPSVGYNNGALKDSIIDNITGVLVHIKTPLQLSLEIQLLINDRVRYNRLRINCIKHTKKMSWDKTATSALTVLQSMI